MRSQVLVRNARRVLCVFPAYAPSFGTFSHGFALTGAKAFMPPQGLLLIAGYLPETWAVRFVDENIRRARPAEFAWADVVFVTGMHIQADQIHDLGKRARQEGKVTVLGGPSVSASPDLYPDYDYLHVGELGDATDALIARLDTSAALPGTQERFVTRERVPLGDFPRPAYDLIRFDHYLLGTLQFSSGCPYQCEFCDIPNLYGRQPRTKSPEQLLGELDFILQQKVYPATVYFVDDNFIANRKATREMLPHLIAWQKRNGYPLTFACEATLNLAKQLPILETMREARFDTVFVGIETPELDALKSIRKGHIASLPMLDAIQTLNRYGLEVVSGIILGLDTDTPETEQGLKDFIDHSQIPMFTLNLLQALPKTPLWDRLSRDGRLIEDERRESNVRFLRPHDEVVAAWKACVAHAYSPTRLYALAPASLKPTEQLEGHPLLPLPTEGESLVADYHATGVSLGRHPLALLRHRLKAAQAWTAERLRRADNGSRVQIAGVVITRQRPGSASGVTFVTLEDETGYCNLIVWKSVGEQYRGPLVQARLLEVHGTLQREDDVIHVIASRLYDRSALLGGLVTTTRDFH